MDQILSCAALLNFLNPSEEDNCCDDAIQDVGVEGWSACFAQNEGAYLGLTAATTTHVKKSTTPF